MVVKEANLKLMARITSRVFLGEELCRNPDWLRITTTYTTQTFRAVEELRLWPAWLRSIVHWFLPNCTAARKLVQEARDVIKPLLEKRRAARMESEARGEKAEWNDAIDWLEQLSQEHGVNYDPVIAQLSLSVAALHSTNDFFTQVTIDIAHHPEIIQPLRDEIKSVLGQGGWTKHSLYNLKLMDSVMKESQRLKPLQIGKSFPCRRMVIDDIN
jgi:cytochrome P450